MTSEVVQGWQHVQGLVERVLDLFFPPSCVGCKRLGYAFCHHCAQAVEAIPTPICARCGRPQPQLVAKCAQCRSRATPVLVHVRAAGLYRWPLREAIHAMKYQGQPNLASFLARYLWAEFMRDEWQAVANDIDFVVPVPLHEKRREERGYNQAHLLAEQFCANTGLPMAADCLIRSRATQQQVGLSVDERRKNVTGAFVATGAVHGKTLLLIDDVTTTGATLEACAHAAAQAGAMAVYGLTLAIPGGGQ